MIDLEIGKCYFVSILRKNLQISLYDRWDILQDIKTSFCFTVIEHLIHTDGRWNEPMIKMLILDEICTSAISYLKQRIDAGDIWIDLIC